MLQGLNTLRKPRLPSAATGAGFVVGISSASEKQVRGDCFASAPLFGTATRAVGRDSTSSSLSEQPPAPRETEHLRNRASLRSVSLRERTLTRSPGILFYEGIFANEPAPLPTAFD